MAAYVLGLDVHSAQSTFVLQQEDGTLVDRGPIPTTPEGLRGLRDRFELPPETPVGLETGTVSFYVARQLARLGLRPVVIDAHEVRLKAHRPLQKSDRRAALEICEGVRRGIYRTIVHVPPRAIAVLRDSLSRRRHFVRRQTAETNAVSPQGSPGDVAMYNSVSPLQTRQPSTDLERAIPAWPMSHELGSSFGTSLTTLKTGATSTPNGRLVGDGSSARRSAQNLKAIEGN